MNYGRLHVWRLFSKIPYEKVSTEEQPKLNITYNEKWQALFHASDVRYKLEMIKTHLFYGDFSLQ